MALLLDITVADDNLIKLLALLCEGSIPVIFQDIQSYNHDLQQVNGFLRALRFPPPIKLTATI
jgi:hypothetical protein